MTNAEAIKIINQYDCNFYWTDGEKIPTEDLIEAFYLAVKALEAQEPRVLMLEEVKGLQSLKDGAIWLEMWRDTAFPAFPEMLLSHISYFVAIPFNGYRGWVRNEYYGKTWRCWSSRPTKEQMEEAKWDDPNSY